MKKVLLLFMAVFSLTTGCAFGAEGSTQVVEDLKKVDKMQLTLQATYKGFQAPTGMALDSKNNLYVSNWSGGSVTKVDEQGNSTIFADGMGSPAGLVFDNEGNLYVADYSRDVIYRIAPAGEKEVFAQGLHTPTGLFFSKKGNLLVANRSSNEIVQVDSLGNVKTVATGMRTPVGVVEGADGVIYVTNYGGGVIRVSAEGKVEDFASDFSRPGVGIVLDGQGRLFAVDNGADSVRLINEDGSTQVVLANIGGCVSLFLHNDVLYVGSWNDGAVYVYVMG